MIASLEQIQCRVIYLPSGIDPIFSYQEQLYLTPNSVNIHARRMSLFSNLFISGFTETPLAVMSVNKPPSYYQGLSNNNSVNMNDDSIMLQKVPQGMIEHSEDGEEMEGVEVMSGLTSIQLIEEIINHGSTLSSQPVNEYDGIDRPSKRNHIGSTVFELPSSSAAGVSAATAGSAAKGIFVLNYRYTHTLNHFLFHMPELLENAGINICIALSVPAPNNASVSGSDSSGSDRPGAQSAPLHLPARFGSLNIVTPVSLRQTKQYIILNMEQNELSEWVLDSTTVMDL